MTGWLGAIYHFFNYLISCTHSVFCAALWSVHTPSKWPSQSILKIPKFSSLKKPWLSMDSQWKVRFSWSEQAIYISSTAFCINIRDLSQVKLSERTKACLDHPAVERQFTSRRITTMQCLLNQRHSACIMLCLAHERASCLGCFHRGVQNVAEICFSLIYRAT